MAPQAKRPRVPAASASVAPPKRQKKSKVDDGAANPPPKAPADAKPAEASPWPKRRRRSVVASADAKPAEASPRGAVGDGQLPPAPVPGPDSGTMLSLRRPRLVGEDRPPPLQGHVPGSSSGWQDAVIVISDESPAKAGTPAQAPAKAGPPASRNWKAGSMKIADSSVAASEVVSQRGLKRPRPDTGGSGDVQEPPSKQVCKRCDRTDRHANPAPKKHPGPFLKFVNDKASECSVCRNFWKSQCQGIPLVDLNKALSDPKRKAEYKDALAVWEKQFNESEGRLRGFHMKLPEWVESFTENALDSEQLVGFFWPDFVYKRETGKDVKDSGQKITRHMNYRGIFRKRNFGEPEGVIKITKRLTKAARKVSQRGHSDNAIDKDMLDTQFVNISNAITDVDVDIQTDAREGVEDHVKLKSKGKAEELVTAFADEEEAEGDEDWIKDIKPDLVLSQTSSSTSSPQLKPRDKAKTKKEERPAKQKKGKKGEKKEKKDKQEEKPAEKATAAGKRKPEPKAARAIAPSVQYRKILALQKVSKEVQATIETCKDEEGLKYVTTKQVSKELAKVEAKRDDVQIHEQVLTKNTYADGNTTHDLQVLGRQALRLLDEQQIHLTCLADIAEALQASTDQHERSATYLSIQFARAMNHNVALPNAYIIGEIVTRSVMERLSEECGRSILNILNPKSDHQCGMALFATHRVDEMTAKKKRSEIIFSMLKDVNANWKELGTEAFLDMLKDLQALLRDTDDEEMADWLRHCDRIHQPGKYGDEDVNKSLALIEAGTDIPEGLILAFGGAGRELVTAGRKSILNKTINSSLLTELQDTINQLQVAYDALQGVETRMASSKDYAENGMVEVWSFKKTIAKLVLRIPAMSKRFSAEFKEKYKYDIILAKKRITQLCEMIPSIQEVAFYQTMQEPLKKLSALVSASTQQQADAIIKETMALLQKAGWKIILKEAEDTGLDSIMTQEQYKAYMHKLSLWKRLQSCLSTIMEAWVLDGGLEEEKENLNFHLPMWKEMLLTIEDLEIYPLQEEKVSTTRLH